MRDAVPDDVPQIVAMLADDPLGARRESPDDLRPYYEALAALTGDLSAAHALGVVGEPQDFGEIHQRIGPDVWPVAGFGERHRLTSQHHRTGRLRLVGKHLGLCAAPHDLR